MMSGETINDNSCNEKEISAWQAKVDSLVEVTAKSLLSLLGADSCYYLSRHGCNNHTKFILEKGKIKSFNLKSGELLLQSLEEKLKTDNTFNIKTPGEEIPAVAFRVFSRFPREELNSNLSMAYNDRKTVYSTFTHEPRGKN